MEETEKKIVLKCTKKDCEYEWVYKGESPFYATCPRCYRKINVKKNSKEKNDT